MLSSGSQWLHNLEALASVCRPVVVDLLGHGRSPSPLDARAYTPEGYIEHFEEVRRSIGAPAWFLIGQSLGAALTLRYALEHPEVVLAQVFTNSSSALADEQWQAQLAETMPRVIDGIERGGPAAIAAMPNHPRRARRLPDDVKAALVSDAERLDPVGIAHALRHTMPTSSVRRRFADISVPTMLVCGTRERAFLPARHFAASVLADLRIVDLDAGHAVNVQAAREFDAAVCSFFAAAVRAGAPGERREPRPTP